jgi:hypothetical protein
MGRTRTFEPLVPPDPRTPATLRRLLDRRRRAIRSLGLTPPHDLAQGPTETLARRIARLDRWLGRELDLAGGKRSSAPEEEDGEEVADPAPRFRSR